MFWNSSVMYPPGSTIAPGQTITVATDGADFETTYGAPADYAMRDPAGGAQQMLTPDTSNPPVWSPTPNASTGGVLTNSGEPTILFRWDGTSDLVQDLDYVFYGTASAANQRVDKSGVMIDGPDADTTPGAYLAETAAFQQPDIVLAAAPNTSVTRISFTEAGETQTGGNGITGNEETSEPFDTNFASGVPTPGAP